MSPTRPNLRHDSPFAAATGTTSAIRTVCRTRPLPPSIIPPAGPHRTPTPRFLNRYHRRLAAQYFARSITEMWFVLHNQKITGIERIHTHQHSISTADQLRFLLPIHGRRLSADIFNNVGLHCTECDLSVLFCITFRTAHQAITGGSMPEVKS